MAGKRKSKRNPRLGGMHGADEEEAWKGKREGGRRS